MVEFEIDGVKYPLVRPLTISELQGIDDASRKFNKAAHDIMLGLETDRDSVNRGPIDYFRMQAAAVSKSFGMTDEELGKLPFLGVISPLFDKLVEYSRSLKK